MTTNESSSVQRIPRTGAGGNSDTTASSSRHLGDLGTLDFKSRPAFEEDCIRALDDFRKGRIDRIAVTTRVAVAITKAYLPASEEIRVFERYFSCIERDENELRAAGSETRLDRPCTRDVEEEKTIARQVHGKGADVDQKGEQSQTPRSSKRQRGWSSVDPWQAGGHPGGSSDGFSSDDPESNSSGSSGTSSNNSDTGSRSSITSSVGTVRRKRVKLDLRCLERVSRADEAKRVPRNLRRTNKLLDNWSQDLKEVVRRFTYCPSRPEFPLTELKNILGGRYVNLDSVLAYYCPNSTEKHTEKIGDLEFSFGSTTFMRSVDTASDWIAAWRPTERAYRFVFPFRADEFREYGEFISQMFSQQQPNFHFRVIQLDKAVRKRIGNCRSLLFSHFHGSLSHHDPAPRRHKHKLIKM